MQTPPGWVPQGYGSPQGYGYGPPRPPPKKGMSGAAIALLTIAGLLVMGVGSCAVCVAVTTKPVRPGSVASAPAKPENDMPLSGEVGYLNDVAGMQAYLVFPTKELLEAWQEAPGDSNANARAILSGAFLASRNTRVKNVTGTMMYLQVELLEGEQKGRRGWVDKTCVHRQKM